MTTRRVLVLLIASVVALWLGPAAAIALEIGQRAPEFELASIQGGTVKLSQFRGKQPVLIEFYGGDFAPV